MPAPVSRRGLGPPGKPLELYDAGFVPLNYAAGTLGYACSQEIDNRIAGKVASSTTMNFWSGSTRNSSCWVADLELSGIALSGTASALISPKHVLGAGHAPPTVGDTFQWVGGSGVTYTRTATSVDILSSDFLSGSDLSIATLDLELLSDVVPLWIASGALDAFFGLAGKYAPGFWYSRRLSRILELDLNNLTDIKTDGTIVVQWFRFTSLFPLYSLSDPRSARAAWNNTQPAGGDSGSPTFLIINGVPVLISSISTTGASGPRIGAQLPWINSIVNAAGYPTNVLTPTGFPRYP